MMNDIIEVVISHDAARRTEVTVSKLLLELDGKKTVKLNQELLK